MAGTTRICALIPSRYAMKGDATAAAAPTLHPKRSVVRARIRLTSEPVSSCCLSGAVVYCATTIRAIAAALRVIHFTLLFMIYLLLILYEILFIRIPGFTSIVIID